MSSQKHCPGCCSLLPQTPSQVPNVPGGSGGNGAGDDGGGNGGGDDCGIGDGGGAINSHCVYDQSAYHRVFFVVRYSAFSSNISIAKNKSNQHSMAAWLNIYITTNMPLLTKSSTSEQQSFNSLHLHFKTKAQVMIKCGHILLASLD